MKHGRTMYQRHNCRCDECKRANTEAIAQWRAERKRQARKHSRVRSRITQLSMVYIRENLPDVYEQIKKEAERLDNV